MYTRTPAMTSFFILGGSSAFIVLEDVLAVDGADVDEAQSVEVCIFVEDFALDAGVEGAGLSS